MTATLALEMPAPPHGMVWVLEINPVYDSMTLWLYKSKWWNSNRPSLSGVKCKSVFSNGGYSGIRISIEDSVDSIVEGVIMTAREICTDMAQEPQRRFMTQEKADRVAAILGIKVKVESR